MKAEWIIPTEWSEVKWTQYTKFQQSVSSWEGTPEWADKLIDKGAYWLCGISANDLRNMPLSAYDQIVDSIKTLIVQSQRQPLVKSFSLGGVKYGFIPDWDSLTYGEYIDLAHLSRATWSNIPEIMSILYRPITDTVATGYRIEKYSGSKPERVEEFRKSLTMDIVWGAIGFFLSSQRELSQVILHSLKEEMKKTIETNGDLRKDLETNGVHTTRLLHSLEKIH
jgi:hypothetical protein